MKATGIKMIKCFVDGTPPVDELEVMTASVFSTGMRAIVLEEGTVGEEVIETKKRIGGRMEYTVVVIHPARLRELLTAERKLKEMFEIKMDRFKNE
jgi:hypothetical protein